MGHMGKRPKRPQGNSYGGLLERATAAPTPAKDSASFRTLLAGQSAVEAEEEARHGPLDQHPESPCRVETCVRRLKADKGLWHSIRKLPPRRAEDEDLQLCHDTAHLAGLQKLVDLAASDLKPRFVPAHGPLCLAGPNTEIHEGAKGTDTFLTRGSMEAVRLSVGSLLQLVDAAFAPVEEDTPAHLRLRTGFALCRPPGHHASSNRSQGFCVVNNVAIAASYARKWYREAKKVLIFDWDVHHGQGTQQIFEDDPDVLVINVHRQDGNFYPNTGFASEVGFGRGRGYTVNVPLPGSYSGPALWEACATVLLPAARKFQPNLILVSAGFDAVVGDPLGGCLVEAKAFGALSTELLRLADELAEGRILFALEGGYEAEALADCVEEVCRALVAGVAEEDEKPFAQTPAWVKGDACRAAIRRTCEVHKSLPLRLPVPLTKAAKRRAESAKPKEPIAEPREEERPAPAAAEVAEAQEEENAESTAFSMPEEVFEMEEEELPESNARPGEAAEEPAPADSERAPEEEGSSIVARLEVLPEELVLRVSPLARPQDVLVSTDELWLLHDGAANAGVFQKWRLEGILADLEGAPSCAEYKRKQQELTVHLRLGQILGGPVRLAPVV